MIGYYFDAGDMRKESSCIIDYVFDQNPQSWVEWTAASVSLSQTKGNDINLIDRFQMQNDTENEIGRSS